MRRTGLSIPKWIWALTCLVFISASGFSQDYKRLDEISQRLTELWGQGALDMEYAGDDCAAKGQAAMDWSERIAPEMVKINMEMNDLLEMIPQDSSLKYAGLLRDGMNPFFDEVSICQGNEAFKALYKKMWDHFEEKKVANTEK